MLFVKSGYKSITNFSFSKEILKNLSVMSLIFYHGENGGMYTSLQLNEVVAFFLW